MQLTDVTISDVQKEDAPAGVETRYEFTLDRSLADDLTLIFYSFHRNVMVYLDGECVYRAGISERFPMFWTVGGIWNKIPISQMREKMYWW